MRKIACCVCAVLLGPAGVRAGVILFSDLGTGANVYNASSAWVIGGAGNSVHWDAFTPSVTTALMQIDAALSFSSGVNSINLSLNSNSGGSPGAVLESWTLTGLPAFTSCCTLQTVTPVTTLTLTAGTEYWIVLSGSAAGGEDFNFNTTGAMDTSFPSQAAGAYDVIGTTSAAPEPGTSLLVLAGLVAAGLIAAGSGRPRHWRKE